MSEDLDNLNESGLPEDAPVEVESDMPGDSEDAQDLDPVALLRGNWRDAWQIPTMLVAGGLLMLGVAYGLSTRPEPDMTPLLTTANRLIESEQYQEAIELLNTEVSGGHAPRSPCRIPPRQGPFDLLRATQTPHP